MDRLISSERMTRALLSVVTIPNGPHNCSAAMSVWISALIYFSCYAAIVPAGSWLYLCDDPRKLR